MTDLFRCPGLEASVNAYPEIFKCPVCKAEVEIWSDEKKARCPVCNKLINKDVLKRSVGQGDKKYYVEVNKHRDDTGKTLYFEQYEAMIPVSLFEYSEKNKTACEACEKYGKNFGCPPFSPDFAEYVRDCKIAKVISVRMPQEYFDQVIQENIYWECCRKAEGLLIDELLRYREKGHLIAGAGACPSCEICAAELGHKECTNPEKRVCSLESLGVNISGLVKKSFNFDLSCNNRGHISNFVCSTGAVFCNKKDI